ncbi:exopolyphosphatase [Halomonas borealis]|uniref:exopolyphosphatase n=1 Tax=Halomonas borealis TaxID=2508710 RepID=UPI0010A02787|nr:exopolyphosphatase [Halomonas borealis]
MIAPTDRPTTDSGEHEIAPRRLAAIDLGSNSFHLLVANYQEDRLQVVARQGDKVQLAAGLDDDGRLTEAAMTRALGCLARFAPFLTGITPGDLRVVGTNALRAADNSQAFIERAEALLGSRIEIISGREEARLIYLGAAHAMAEEGRRLIVDIGGGSTEFIIGEDFEPQALESLSMGCVTYTRRFFESGEIDEACMRRAELAALSELANIQRPFQTLGWNDPVGSSGTIKAAAAVIAAADRSPEGVITRAGLQRLRQRLLDFQRLDRVALDGLKADRAQIFPAGIAILGAIFEAFDLAAIRYSDGALREGVLYDMAGRNSPEDSRLKTLANLERLYGVDPRQADNVAATACALLHQVRDRWRLDDDRARFLEWASRLHEIGLTVSHSQFHRHGAYLLEHSDLAGFSRTEQRQLAFLVRAHRRTFPLEEWQALPAVERPAMSRLARLLRLAVLINHSRPEHPPATPTLSLDDEGALRLQLQGHQPSLLRADLEQETAYQQAAGLVLTLDSD